MFPTVATHTPRNSRGTGGGAVSVVTTRALDGATWPHATVGADQFGQLTVGQYAMTFEVYGRECRLRVVVGHKI